MKQKLRFGLDTAAQDNFLHHPLTKDWLGQFEPIDQSDVIEMVNTMRLVSRDAFALDLQKLIAQRIEQGTGPVGLYAEREIRKYRGIPNALFKHTKTKVKRATGGGPQPVKPTRAYDPEVGSEGIVAQLITEVCRLYKGIAFNHPGPDEIRRQKIRRMLLITDLIGTGTRAYNYLSATWKVKSVRSWHSLGLMKFEVIAYSGTDEGMKRVKSHRCKPIVLIAAPCPTIDTSFTEEQAQRIKNICIRHDPVDHHSESSLGYQGQGCLIAFAHGVPNNAPRILHKANNKAKTKWTPLFPARVTADLVETFCQGMTLEAMEQRLKAMHQYRLAKTLSFNKHHPTQQSFLMVLAALKNKPRNDIAIASARA